MAPVYTGSMVRAVIDERLGGGDSGRGSVALEFLCRSRVTHSELLTLIDDLQQAARLMMPPGLIPEEVPRTVVLTERGERMTDKMGFWTGHVPGLCEVTRKPITDEFVDGRTAVGLNWKIMHPSCLETGIALGLGLGRGARYRRQSGGPNEGRFLKVES